MPPSETHSDQPLVSVICRTTGRPELSQALASINSQSYPAIELVLVDAGALGKDGMDAIEPATLFVSTGIRLSRSEAANAGLDAATGRYLMFLDEDDWIDTDHIGGLIKTLQENKGYKAAYSNTCKTSKSGEPLDYVFDQDYDPLLLMRDNYIPIHAMLFEAGLRDQGCRFDERFDIYEDWDFWLQLSQHTPFYHLNRTTAFYRAGGDSETTAKDDKLRYQPDSVLGKARAALFDKWSPQWSGDEINRLMGHLLQTDRITELEQDWARMAQEVENKQQETEELHRSLEQARQLQYEAENNLEALRTENKRIYAQNTQMREAQRLIENSLSWRITAPLRWLKSRVAGNRFIRKSESKIKAEMEQAATNAITDFLDNDETLDFTPTQTPELAIILIFFNRAALSFLCLQSLLRHADVPFELVIIDNASSDDTRKLLERIKGAEIKRNKNNEGFVKAVNQGVKRSSAPNILLLNNDAQIEPHALSIALRTLSSSDDIGAVGAQIRLLDGSLQEAGSIIWNNGSCLGYGRGDDPEAGPYNFRREVDYCSGAFLLFSRKDFEALDGFDEAYAPAYYEESDFCTRLKARGLSTVYEPRARITHYEFASSGGLKGAAELQLKHRKLYCQRHPEFLKGQWEPGASNVLRARTANSRANVLVIDDRVPHPSLGSGFPRSAQILNILSELDFNVCFYPLQFPEEQWQDIYETLAPDIEVILSSGRRKLGPFLKERWCLFDTIIVSREHNMRFFNNALGSIGKSEKSPRIIYDAEALTAPREILRKELAGARFTDTEKDKLISKELDLARGAQTILAVSEAEARSYLDHGYTDVRVLGHTLEPVPTPKKFGKRHGLLFVGALHTENSPNVDSLHWFMNNCMPLIEKEIPDIQLHVCGDSSAPSLSHYRQSNIHFHGRLESLLEFYNSSRAFIAPTRFAAGIPHKVHEAAAHGLPSVTTPLLATQLGWENDRQLLEGETPEQFSMACIRLHQDEACWNRVREQGLEALRHDCSPESFQRMLESLFD